MTHPDPSHEEAPAGIPETDQKSRVPQRPEETDASGDSLNGVGEDNQRTGDVDRE